MATAERNAMIKEIYEKGLLETLYKEVIESERKKIRVGDIQMKQKIVIENADGKETWIAISRTEDGIMFLLDKEYEIKNVRFSDYDNNYIDSKVRRIANNCSPTTRAINVLGKDSFIPLEIDLFSHDGLNDYGICKRDLFGILTYDMYRNNRKNIELSYMWLSTPYSTSNGYSSDYVMYVSSGGCVSCGWYRDCEGVRPFFILKPDIFVSLAE